MLLKLPPAEKVWDTVGTVVSGLQSLQTVGVCERAQSCLSALCDPMACSSPPTGYSVYGILQARILEQRAVSFSTGSS